MGGTIFQSGTIFQKGRRIPVGSQKPGNLVIDFRLVTAQVFQKGQPLRLGLLHRLVKELSNALVKFWRHMANALLSAWDRAPDSGAHIAVAPIPVP
jgi:hypothetical protein